MVVRTAGRAYFHSNRNFLLQDNFYLCSGILCIQQCLKSLRQAPGKAESPKQGFCYIGLQADGEISTQSQGERQG